MSNNKLILIVEDEVKIAQLLADYLKVEGFDSQILLDGADAIDSILTLKPAAVILDRMLPNVDGLSICKTVRKSSDVPILMLTARIDEIDRLIGLESGADDYVCKPFSVREVVTRIQIILRRVQQAQQVHSLSTRLEHANIVLDTDKFSCHLDNQAVELTLVEFRILKTLMAKPGVVFSRDSLMANCYDDGRIVSHRTIDSHMKNLRHKLTSKKADSPIQAIYGVGYKLN
ncbi:response regulator [Catenovulum agarivorans]|uniref:response regulator n=1 Tax=Catenovulum agarivorans TaxID=1172192 RepID=UPI0002DCDE12|nr:response regulator [Catenovulum agarivorans]